ncbi:MAG: polyamine aminopropyltransferase [Patescibacteria group bacterium]
MATEISSQRRIAALLASTFLVAMCALAYELLMSSVSSYFLGNSITHFSLTIGLFLSFMGLGSFLSKRIEDNLLDRFIFIEIILSIVGGFSTLALYAAFTFTPYFYLVVFAFIGLIGTLIGFEIPLITRIVERHQKLSHAVAHVFTADYLGSLIASVTFALVLLPWLGLMRSAFAIALINIVAAIITLIEFRSQVAHPKRLVIGSLIATTLLIAGAITTAPTVSFFEQRLYKDEILYSKQSAYQNIVLTKFHDDVRLFLNGSLQFSSVDEYRYHESLVHIPMSSAATRESVLILGGGDGLAAREVLKYDDVQSITLVDLDPAVTDLASTYPPLTNLNQGSLTNTKVTVVNEDAQTYLEHSSDRYSVILIDLPDPNDITLGKLYSVEFYSLVAQHLAEGGIVVTQATSPYFSRSAYWCITTTMEEVFGDAVPYTVNVPSFGPWGFVMASNANIPPASISVSTKYLTPEIIPALFTFDIDMQRVETDINTLDNQSLVHLYDEGWQQWYQN